VFARSLALGAQQIETGLQKIGDYRNLRWYTSQFLETPLVVRITQIDNPSQCERQKVDFTNAIGIKSGGDIVQPMPVAGIWNAAGGYCEATMYWRLGDTPGQQRMFARIERPTPDPKILPDVANEAALTGTQVFDAVAHAYPSFIVGLAYLPNGVKHVQADDADAERKRMREYQPIVGADLPLGLSLIPNRQIAPFMDHMRLVLATSFGDPGIDFYYGLELAPIFEGARASAAPLQVSFGGRAGIHSTGNVYVAVHISGSSVISSALAGFGLK
jgi:hypothetical protein